MYNYIIGTIKQIEDNYIVLENNSIGYLIYMANPYKFQLNQTYQLYVYQYVREDEISLYGFDTFEEKQMFLKLIDVKGLGCKMALPMFASGNLNQLMEAIEEENISYLKKFPKIGDKVARQIILDLKGKLIDHPTNNQSNEELMEALKTLGYKKADIQKIISKIDITLSIEKQVKEALNLLLK